MTYKEEDHDEDNDTEEDSDEDAEEELDGHFTIAPEYHAMR